MITPHCVVTPLGLSLGSSLPTFLSSEVRHQIATIYLQIPSDLMASASRIIRLLSHIGETLSYRYSS
jgi:hypothetical protein